MSTLIIRSLHDIYEATSDEWVGILKIACEWDFAQVRNMAVRHIDLSGLSTIRRLYLYLLYRAEAPYVVPLYVSLCMRDKGPTDEETEVLGMKTVLLIWRMREHLRAHHGTVVLPAE